MNSVKKGSREMKKKIAAYTTTAILIGIAIMTLPLTLQQPSSLTPMGQTPASNAFSDRASAPTEGNSPFSGLVRQPANLMPLGVISLSGLIVALSVYLILKKKAS